MKLKYFNWIFFLLLMSCNSREQKQTGVKIESKENSSYMRLTDSCNSEMKHLSNKNTIIPDDTTKTKEHYKSKTITRKDFNFTYNILMFNTGNKLFDKQLENSTKLIVNNYYSIAKKDYYSCIENEDKKEIESIKYRYYWGIEMIPIFLDEKSASLQVNTWEYMGGIHGNNMNIFTNYIFQNGKIKKLHNKDFIEKNLDLDTIYFDPISDKFVFQHQKDCGCYSVCGGWNECVFSINDLLSDDTNYSARYFVFYSDGIKIKNYSDRDGGTFNTETVYQFDNKVIPKNEFKKIASKSILKLWREKK